MKSYDENYGRDINFNSQFVHPKIGSDSRIECHSMALYFNPTKYRVRNKGLFSQDIERNKSGPNDATKRLAESMYDFMNDRFPSFREADFIVSVPNHMSNHHPGSGGVGIAKELHSIFQKNSLSVEIKEILEKNFSQKLRFMYGRDSREHFFESNRTFSVKKPVGISENRIRSSSVLLVDDVMTLGLTTQKCIELLLGIGFKKIFLFVAAKDYFRH